METQTKRYKPTKYKISKSETQSKTKTQTKLKMIASCKGMNGMTPEEVEIIIGGNDCDINIPTFIDINIPTNLCSFTCLKLLYV
jgi:hypothetical protein